MKPPCKGCISYPICIGQKQLSCEDLYTFFNDNHDRLKLEAGADPEKIGPFSLPLEKRNEVWDELWEIMYEFLPNITGMFRSTRRQRMPAMKFHITNSQAPEVN